VSEPATTRLGDLARLLRVRGMRVGTGELLGAHRALASLDAADVDLARTALRATLCGGRDDLAVFEEAWDEWLLGARRELFDPPGLPEELDETLRSMLPQVPASEEPPAAAQTDVRPAPWSEVELLLQKDFAHYNDAELEIARRVLRRLATRGAQRVTRRTRPARRGHRLDVQRTLRASLRSGGEPLRPCWRGPRLGPRPVVLVADVSGSMQHYARLLLMYLQAAVTARGRVEAFAFSTRLTRITRELRSRDADAALERATAAVVDVHGGTRIGESIATLNRDYGRVVGRGAIVVVLSDGWDRGDPELLAAEIARLHRCAHRLLWCNPLAADPRWEPLTRGMAAAVPHVDHLLPGHSLGSLAELAELLEEVA
jgi:uncharacterized protein with von Willebrand factor type A (vWA) domain